MHKVFLSYTLNLEGGETKENTSWVCCLKDELVCIGSVCLSRRCH